MLKAGALSILKQPQKTGRFRWGREILHGIVLLAVFWIAVPVAIFAGSVVLKGIGKDHMLSAFVALYLVIALLIYYAVSWILFSGLRKLFAQLRD